MRKKRDQRKLRDLAKEVFCSGGKCYAAHLEEEREVVWSRLLVEVLFAWQRTYAVQLPGLMCMKSK